MFEVLFEAFSIFLKGLDYIHNSFLKAHRRLKGKNCVIDSRWVLKIDDFGLENLRVGKEEKSTVKARI